MFYSKTTGGFYSRVIHGDNIPADAVEITPEQHTALLQGQSEGKVISADENGYPILQDLPQQTADQIEEAARFKRDTLLTACDWVVIRSQELGQPVPQAWSDYRQALRDVPQQGGFPEEVEWPTEPELQQ